MSLSEKLQDFIKRAERNYKYKPNTANALSGAVKLFSNVMTNEELSQDAFPIDKLDEIGERIHIKFVNKYSVDSLQTYKSRINRIVSDFTDYGADAKSMASWNPLSKQRKRAGTTKTNAKSVSSESNKSNKTMTGIHLEDSKPTELPDLQDIRLPLAGNRNVVIYYPMDLSEVEAEKIGTVLKGIAALSKNEAAEEINSE
jgi:hypothetical protein